MKILYGVAALAVIALTIIAATIPLGPRWTDNQASRIEPQPAPARTRHTMGNYLELKEGMSYDAAARTLGHPGREVPKGAARAFEDAGTVTFAWQNADGSQILLAFKGDRLFRWAQAGLR